MKDMMSMMKKARDMQKNMTRVQKELEETDVTGTSGGGAVSIVMSCTNQMRSVKISPDAVDPADVETLEDLVQAAVSDAVRQAQSTAEARMKEVTGGMSLPGM